MSVSSELRAQVRSQIKPFRHERLFPTGWAGDMSALRCIIWCAVSSRAQNEPDKTSLSQQEADGRELALKNDWPVIDVMRVPGHSRRYIDFHKRASDAAHSGIGAFHRLEAHWDAQDFDVMAVLDGKRCWTASGAGRQLFRPHTGVTRLCGGADD